MGKSTLTNIPKTAAGFESDYNILKKDPSSYFTYLKVNS